MSVSKLSDIASGGHVAALITLLLNFVKELLNGENAVIPALEDVGFEWMDEGSTLIAAGLAFGELRGREEALDGFGTEFDLASDRGSRETLVMKVPNLVECFDSLLPLLLSQLLR
jgi:hypothetical protein